jgi:hypothetical protein
MDSIADAVRSGPCSYLLLCPRIRNAADHPQAIEHRHDRR